MEIEIKSNSLVNLQEYLAEFARYHQNKGVKICIDAINEAHDGLKKPSDGTSSAKEYEQGIYDAVKVINEKLSNLIR